MLPNNHPDPAGRLEQLIRAVKLVYASTYYESPKAYAKSTMHRTEDEKMAVVIQALTGNTHGDYYYPAVSGVAQSYNFYPIAHMQPREGIAHIALGLGKIVVEGGTSLRFSPKYPQFLPQCSTVDDILKNTQRSFYAVNMSDFPEDLGLNENATLVYLTIDDVTNHAPVRLMSSTYFPEDHRIRDGAQGSGYLVLTFANVLKYDTFPLADILSDILEIGRQGMGCPVEIEFAVNLPVTGPRKASFNILQIRPMAITQHNMDVEISDADIANAICYSSMALGNGRFKEISDIIFVDPDKFDPGHTLDIAAEIGQENKWLVQEDRKYLLIGPGRWGSADRWLGISVRWNDISGVGAMIETTTQNLKADPSQGSHFFHNITSLGISYLTTAQNSQDFIKWEWLQSLPTVKETTYLKHLRLDNPLTIKIDGKTSSAVVIP